MNKVKYKVMPIGIKTTIPAMKLLRSFENIDFLLVLSVIKNS